MASSRLDDPASTSRTINADYYSNRRGKLSALIATGEYELFASTTEHEYYIESFRTSFITKDISQER